MKRKVTTSLMTKQQMQDPQIIQNIGETLSRIIKGSHGAQRLSLGVS